MENQKNSKGLVALLAVLVVVLGALCILFATGTISLNNKTTTNDDLNTGNNSQETTDTNKIDSALLNSLYDTLGINWESKSSGDCLNKFLSNSNYNDVNYKDNPNDYSSNAKRVFSLYASHNYMTTYRYNDYNCGEDCKHYYTCAECTSILKTNANKIKKLYSLDNLKLDDLPGVDSDYAYSTGISVGVCHYGITHDTSSEYIDSNSIRIIDKQVVTDYVFGEDNKVNSTKNQTVTYDFKKDSDGNYYLSQVSVK